MKVMIERFDIYVAPKCTELIERCKFRCCKQSYDEVNVQYKSHSVKLMLYVVPDSRHALFGRDWLGAMKLDWTEIKFSSGSGSVCL